MLYVSKMVGMTEYCVCDTDTNNLTIMDGAKLIKLSREHKVPVAGVDLQRMCINPWQHPSYVTNQLLKLKMLIGIELRVWRGLITYMRVDYSILPDGYRLHPSDYAASWSHFMVIDCVNYTGSASRYLTIVLDDKLKVESGECVYPIHEGVKFDITELNNERVVYEMYRLLNTTVTNPAHRCDFMIDRPERMKNIGGYNALR